MASTRKYLSSYNEYQINYFRDQMSYNQELQQAQQLAREQNNTHELSIPRGQSNNHYNYKKPPVNRTSNIKSTKTPKNTPKSKSNVKFEEVEDDDMMDEPYESQSLHLNKQSNNNNFEGEEYGDESDEDLEDEDEYEDDDGDEEIMLDDEDDIKQNMEQDDIIKSLTNSNSNSHEPNNKKKKRKLTKQ